MLAAFVLGAIALGYSGSRLQVSYRTALTGCARDNGTGGASAVYRLLLRLGIPVRDLHVPIWEAAERPGDEFGHCVLTMGNGSWSPTGDDLDSAEWRNYRDWIALGNTLIVVTSAPASLPADLRRDLISPVFQQPGTEPDAATADGVEIESRPETSQAVVSGGGSLTVASKGPRWSPVSKAPAPDAKANGSAKSTPAPKPKAANGEVGTDAARWQLAGDAAGGVLFRLPVGKGAIYVLLDAFAWTNAGLDQGDNARVLAAILRRELVGVELAFDEYRHGHGRSESFLAYLLHLPGSSAVLWLAVVWATLYIFGRNVRLGPADVFVEQERRTAQEYIDAVAQLYERARAAPLVVEAVGRRLRQLSRSSAEQPAAVSSLLERADHLRKAEKRPGYPAAEIRLVTELIKLRKEIYGTRTLS